MSTETQRAEFEAWARSNHLIGRSSGRLSPSGQIALAAWQAAQSYQAAEIEALRTTLQELLDLVHQGRLVPLDDSNIVHVQAAVDAGELALDPAYVGPALIPNPIKVAS